MKKTIQVTGKVALAGLLISSLAGCGVVDKVKDLVEKNKKPSVSTEATHSTKKVEDKGEVLVFIKGEPAVYEKDFMAQLDQMLQAYPQLKGMMTIDNLPPQMKENILQQLADTKLITNYWAKEADVQNSKDFQESLKETIAMLKDHLILKAFEKRIFDGIEVLDSQIKAEYEKNKDKFVKVPGGVEAMGIKFDKEDDAKAFEEKVAAKLEDFKELAQKDGIGEFKKFGKINDDSSFPGLPSEVKTAALAATKFPKVETVKADGAVWVVFFKDKKDTEYASYDEVKGHIEEMLRGQKAQEASQKEIAKLKKEYPVQIKKEALESKAPKAEQKEESKPAAAVAA